MRASRRAHRRTATDNNAAAPNEFAALHDLNIAITAGEFACLVDPFSCGKSTLLRIDPVFAYDKNTHKLFLAR